jgi:hypothetical protein
MAEFLVRLVTPAQRRPETRQGAIEERAAIQSALLQIVNAVSNHGTLEGVVAGGAAKGEFEYVVD